MDTNTSVKELFQFASKAITTLKKNEALMSILNTDQLINLLKILLENNEFKFDGRMYNKHNVLATGV